MAEKTISLKLNEVRSTPNGFRRFEYNPNVIHNKGMCEVEVLDDSLLQYSEPSCTDQEAYRVTLASMRGILSNQGMFGSPNTGSYSIPAGKEYNPDLDFSYLRRKDLTIVDIDNYISNMKANLEKYDGELKLEIENALKEAESIKADKVSKQSDNSDTDSE